MARSSDGGAGFELIAPTETITNGRLRQRIATYGDAEGTIATIAARFDGKPDATTVTIDTVHAIGEAMNVCVGMVDIANRVRAEFHPAVVRIKPSSAEQVDFLTQNGWTPVSHGVQSWILALRGVPLMQMPSFEP